MTVKKEVCFLPREKGGINMVDLHTIVKVKRIKWIVKMLQAEYNECWSILPRQFMKCMDAKLDIEYFLLRVNVSHDLIDNSSIPPFYKECILVFQELCRKGRDRNMKQNDIIWCNSEAGFNEKPLCFSHWSKSGIKYIGDIIQNGVIKEEEIYNKLVWKSGYTFEIQKLKKSIPDTWKTWSIKN